MFRFNYIKSPTLLLGFYNSMSPCQSRFWLIMRSATPAASLGQFFKKSLLNVDRSIHYSVSCILLANVQLRCTLVPRALRPRHVCNIYLLLRKIINVKQWIDIYWMWKRLLKITFLFSKLNRVILRIFIYYDSITLPSTVSNIYYIWQIK